MRFVAATKFLLLLVLILAAGFALYAHARRHPEDMPWTSLDLGRPIGVFTGRKLAGLTGDAPRCRALLDRAGVRYEALPALSRGPSCGYADGVSLGPGGAREIVYTPLLGTACPVAAALAMWEWRVVQPAALRHFGAKVVRIEHYGSYSCRPIAGSARWSEHSTADAIDIAGFRLADGRRITVAADWTGGGKEAAFLREVRDGACQLFATTLSPDYNAAHADHLHLDQAARGAMGWRGCR